MCVSDWSLFGFVLCLWFLRFVDYGNFLRQCFGGRVYVWFLCCLADGVWVLTNGNGVMLAFVGCKLIPCLFCFDFICCMCEAFVSHFGWKCVCECFYEMLLSRCWC